MYGTLRSIRFHSQPLGVNPRATNRVFESDARQQQPRGPQHGR